MKNFGERLMMAIVVIVSILVLVLFVSQVYMFIQRLGL